MAAEPGDERGGEDLHERVLRRMVAAFPEPQRAAVLARMLDTLERLHRDSGAEPPAWIARLRRRLGG